MKRIFFLGLVFTLIAMVSSAQQPERYRYRHQRETESFHHGQLDRFEQRHLRQDHFRYRMARRRALHDGMVTPLEHRRLNKMRRHERSDLYRFRHNDHRRVI